MKGTPTQVHGKSLPAPQVRGCSLPQSPVKTTWKTVPLLFKLIELGFSALIEILPLIFMFPDAIHDKCGKPSYKHFNSTPVDCDD